MRTDNIQSRPRAYRRTNGPARSPDAALKANEGRRARDLPVLWQRSFMEATVEMNPSQMATTKQSTSTWRYDEGILTIRHLGERVSLGRYATRDDAAKAAAAYFAYHGGQK